MDVLRLSDDQNQWLKILSSTSVFKNEDIFQIFLDDVTQSLLTPEHRLRILLDSKDDEKTAIFQAAAALSSILVEAAKRNSAVDAVGLYLHAVGVSDRRAKAITDIYGAKRNQLRKILSSSGFGFPFLTDVDWRLDWTIKSNEISRIGEPMYCIQLQTVSETGQIGAVQFSSSVEELQELIWSLKNAIKSVERQIQQ